jgi:hypothetical protein
MPEGDTHFEKVPGTDSIYYASRADHRIFPMFYVEHPDWNDIRELLDQVGYPTRADYTFVITGHPSKDSPKTGFSRGYDPDDPDATVTLSFTRTGEMAEYAFEGTPNDDNAAEEFASYITEFEDMTWDRVDEIAILDKDYPDDYGGFFTRYIGGPNG